MVNFFVETEEILDRYGYDFDDVVWIGGTNQVYDLNSFLDAAKKYFYDNGYGFEGVSTDLKIMMRDGVWFSRYSYDGSEKWVINRAPRRPEKKMYVLSFGMDCYKPVIITTTKSTLNIIKNLDD